MIEDEPEVRTLILDASGRDDAIRAILAHMAGEGMLAHDAVPEIREGIDRRHALGSHAIGQGLAFPHIKSSRVARYLLVIALLTNPNTDWNSLDAEPVDLVFLIVGPFEPAQSCRKYFERLHRKLRAGLIERLRSCVSPEELADALKTFGADRSW